MPDMRTLDIDLWIWPLDPSEAEATRLSAVLSAEEEARAARFVRPEHGRAFRVGRGRLREILGQYACTDPAMLSFAYNDFGKPSLRTGPVFNLSHAAGWAALAVLPAATCALGIDIERHRRVEEAVAKRFFSEAEQVALAALPPHHWSDGFFRCWTRKEAMVKACGPGLSMPLDSFDVTLAPDEPPRVTRLEGLPGANPEDWGLIHLDLAPDFVGAIAVEAGAYRPVLRIHQGKLPIS